MKLQRSEVLEVIEELNKILSDATIPRNVRVKIRCANEALCDLEKHTFAIKIDRSLQELDEVSDDPNIPIYAKTQIWNVVSMLEKCNRL